MSTEAENITEQLRLTLAKMEISMGTVADAIVWTNKAGVIQWCNTGFDRLLGKTHIEILGKNMHDIFLLEKDARSVGRQDYPILMVNGEDAIYKNRYEYKRGHENFFLEIRVTSTVIREKLQVISVIRDISRIVLTTQELERSNQDLEQFAYVTSHDLKAPLRGITSLAQWLSTDYKDKLDADGQEQLCLLINRVRRMHNLIDAILQYSRVGRRKEEETPVDLNELVGDIVDSLDVPAHIEVAIDNTLPVVTIQKVEIEQVFQNLLSNALRFVDKAQGKIRVRCEEDANAWKFSVSDNGCGIEEKYFDKIFKIFQTLVSSEDPESTGVGLAIVKSIIERAGGRIWVESRLGVGTTFYFTLPKSNTNAQCQDRRRT